MARRGQFERQIHILWLQGEAEAPPLVQACIETWRRLHPTWQINLLDEASLRAFLTPDEWHAARHMSRAALSDLVRLALLVRRGGVWVDATCAARVPLEGWLGDVMTEGFFAFDQPGRDRPIASWFMAATKGHPIPTILRDATLRVWQQPSVKAVDPPESSQRWLKEGSMPWRQNDFWQSIETLPYFWLHYLFDLMRHNRQDFRTAWDAVPKLSAHLPQALARRGLLKEGIPTERLEAAIDTLPAPLVKLNWRHHSLERQPGLKRLFQGR